MADPLDVSKIFPIGESRAEMKAANDARRLSHGPKPMQRNQYSWGQ
jgi:hypothetical protein